MDVVPGAGHRLRPRWARCCCWRSALYVGVVAARCGCRATCSTASCSARSTRLRDEVEDKLNRLPLRYFDRQPRGELLSRVTNDIDNVAQTLQQTLSQLLTSLLTVVGVLVMMFVVSPLLALIALVTIPLSVLVTERDRQAVAEAVHRPVEAHRRAERPDRGGVHRARAGQGVRPAARGRGRVRRRRTTSCSRPASAPSSSPGIDHAVDDVHREPELRGDRGGRRPAGGRPAR